MNVKKILGGAFFAFCILGSAKANAENSVAEYEKNLDIYNFDKKIEWQQVYEISQKLRALEPLNTAAFRAEIYYYREQNDFKTAVARCNEILKIKKCPPEIAIEANSQLGDIYFRYFDDIKSARKFVNAGIALVKKNYSKAEIEKFVNGTTFLVRDLVISGKTNSIRELYILKSDIENLNPTLKSESVMQDLELVEDKIFDVKYKTDW